jgi:hypothetical protein
MSKFLPVKVIWGDSTPSKAAWCITSSSDRRKPWSSTSNVELEIAAPSAEHASVMGKSSIGSTTSARRGLGLLDTSAHAPQV